MFMKDTLPSLPVNIQLFARPTFNPDNVTMMDAKTGEIPFSQSDQILTDVETSSAYMQLATAVTMTKPIEKFTHMSGVGAYWVSEAERIRTSKPTWIHTEMRAHKIAVIIPTTKENLKYSVTQFFSLMRPKIAEAFYKRIDQAGFVGGGGSPFAQNIFAAATTAGQIMSETSNKYDDINNAMALIEANDLAANGIASTNGQKVKYRGTKDATGMPIFNAPRAGVTGDVLGLPVAFMSNASFGDDSIAEIVGDWNNAYYGILQGIQYEILTEATLTTVSASDGDPLSLAERDMVAIKATMEIGIMVVKDEAFSVITKASTPTG